MRIENQSAKNVEENVRSSATRAAGSEATAGNANLSHSANDQVSLSGASNLLDLAKSLPSFKQSKIDALTNQVRSGTYQVDAAATSRSLLEQHATARA